MGKQTIYHVVTPAEWQDASYKTYYEPRTFVREGFIHCCEYEQLPHVTSRYFTDHDSIVILCIDSAAVSAPIKYEDLANIGVEFPHIYGRLNLEAVRRVFPMHRAADKQFRFPLQEL
jgi:uncharacterized protein (DUF952 family)